MYNYTRIKQLLADDLTGYRTGGYFSDLSIAEIRAHALSESLLKKCEDVINDDADAIAIQKFLDCNTTCGNFKLEPKKLFQEEVLVRCRKYLYDYFYDTNSPIVREDGTYGGGYSCVLDPDAIFRGAGLGPGANLDCKSCDFYTKMYNSSLSSTSESLYTWYKSAIAFNPGVLCAEDQRHLIWGRTIVEGNKVSTVPKTKQVSRVICTEPLLNMFFQKGIGSIIEKLLVKYHNIDLHEQQSINKDMALAGSIDGSFGTIDLSSASDSISCNLVDAIFPPEVSGWLMRTRSPVTTLPNGVTVKLDMISSQGNGFNFPLQTLIFATLVKSCYEVMGITPRPRGPKRNYSVNGDDIIVCKDSYEFVVSCLEMFGFTVNKDKSFNSGGFRESCGGDYFHGKFIRGVYIKSLLSDQLVYSAVNRLNRWSELSGISLPKLTSYLLSGLKAKLLYVPNDESDSAGLKTDEPPDHFKRTNYGTVIYYAYRPQPRSISVTAKRWPYEHVMNYYGMLQAALGGYIRSHKLLVRADVVTYKVKRCYSPNWRTATSPTGVERRRTSRPGKPTSYTLS